jgi:hypothetical protein
MQSVDRITSTVFICHFDESKTLATTSVAVLNHLSAAYRTELSKHFFQALVSNTVRQVTDIKFLTQNPKLQKKLTLTLLLGSLKRQDLRATLAKESEEQTDSDGI